MANAAGGDMSSLRIAFFGSSLVSAYWNGAATYYRGIIKALHARGHKVVFYEPDAYDRQKHRDIPDPPYARVVVYSAENEADVLAAVESAKSADIIVKASGVGVHDRLLDEAVLNLRSSLTAAVFWDVDAPATLDRLEADPTDPFHQLIPLYDTILTYGGGPPVVSAYEALGAQGCVPIYNAVDPETHFPVKWRNEFATDLFFLGNRLPDRESRVTEFFLKPARSLPLKSFRLGGNGWSESEMPPNVTYQGHVYTSDHNAFNCSATAILNVSRESMARYGYSPATRIFEAAGAGACIISDNWDGLDSFFEPGKEVLTADNGDQVVDHLTALQRGKAQEVGRAALRRVLAEHTYQHRADIFEKTFDISKSIPHGGMKACVVP